MLLPKFCQQRSTKVTKRSHPSSPYNDFSLINDSLATSVKANNARSQTCDGAGSERTNWQEIREAVRLDVKSEIQLERVAFFI